MSIDHNGKKRLYSISQLIPVLIVLSMWMLLNGHVIIKLLGRLSQNSLVKDNLIPKTKTFYHNALEPTLTKSIYQLER